MKIVLGLLVALIVFAALLAPTMFSHQTTTAHTAAPAMYVADGPTPTPTPNRNGGNSGCQGGGGC